MRVLACRLSLSLLFGGVYLALPCTPLCRIVRTEATVCLHWLGHRADERDEAGQSLLIVDGLWFAITPDCTYLDLMLIVAPLCWNLGVPIKRNVLRLGALIVAISVVNTARVIVALGSRADGASWFLAHNLPDMLICYPAITLAVIRAIVEDYHSGRRTVQSEASHVRKIKGVRLIF
jgi:exosortase/archaeosortase